MILNADTNKVLSRSETYCKTPWEQAWGLMFSKKQTKVFVFKKPIRDILHMFFVFYSIDALFLDSKKKVIEMKKAFKPFQVYKMKKAAQYIIECPAGTITKTKTALGHTFQFKVF